VGVGDFMCTVLLMQVCGQASDVMGAQVSTADLGDIASHIRIDVISLTFLPVMVPRIRLT